MATARSLIEVLGPKTIKQILHFLAEGYWDRYLGWPDLLVLAESGWYFAEVKSSNDRLSGNQKDWITKNSTVLHLPFELVKVHRKIR